ncbi:MAG: NAD-binding protein, partial [Geitlerinemataceae cyanobacterium]
VAIVDTDSEACSEAEREGLKVFQSSALDTKVLEEAGLASIGTFLAVTSNGEVNLVLAQRAMEEFQPPRTLAIFPKDSPIEESKNQTKVQQAFMPAFPLKTWNQYLRDQEIKLGETVLRETGFAFQKAHLQALIRSGELLPLLKERDQQLQAIAANEAWQPGERILYLLHAPKPKLLKRLSGANPSQTLTLEKLPEVEEIAIPAAVLEKPLEKVNTES